MASRVLLSADGPRTATRSAADVIVLLLAAGGPQRIHPRRTWPLHAALRHLAAQLTEPDEAMAAFGGHEARESELLTNALASIVEEGLLSPDGNGRATQLVLTQQAAELRRRLMRHDPGLVRAIHEAARVWETLAATSEKNWSQAASSAKSKSR